MKTRILEILTLTILALSTGYLVGSNNGKDFKEQFVSLKLECLHQIAKESKFHAKQARLILDVSKPTPVQSRMYVFATIQECMQKETK